MIKKHKFEKTKKEEIDRAKEELKSLEDLPLAGGLVKGLEKFVDLAEKVQEAGGKIERKGEIHPPKFFEEKFRRVKGKEGEIKGIYGFSIGTLEGKPRIQTFGNIHPVKSRKAGAAKPQFDRVKITETREPIVDVFDEKDHVLIVAELPGISEKDIEINLKGDILILEAGEEEKRKYYKEVLLPSKVKAETEERTYKNGILEIKFKKA